jgi:CTP:molybdopterin cytidylyltransferase MocA
MGVAAVVLAAGAATRYGRPKQRELLPAVLDRLARTSVDHVVVVEGAYRLDAVIRSRPGDRVAVVTAPDWARGPGASLRAGLAALPADVTHAVVVLADGPGLDPRAVERVLARRAAGPVLAASYDGARSHPVLLAREAWDAVPDVGARALEPLLVDCADLDPPGDVDEREDTRARGV